MKLAVMPGDDRPDPRLAALSTGLPAGARNSNAYFRAGGVGNMRRLLRRIAGEIGYTDRGEAAACPSRAPSPGRRSAAPRSRRPPCAPARRRPLALMLVYRSAVLAGDTRAVEALAEALDARGVAPLIAGGVEPQGAEPAVAAVRRAVRARRPDVIVSTTAFSARDDRGFVLDEADCPVLQAMPVGGREGPGRLAAGP